MIKYAIAFLLFSTAELPTPEEQVTQAPAAMSVVELDGVNLNLVFEDDFENGIQRWQTTDQSNWKLKTRGKGQAFGLASRKSKYQPPVRSPHNIAIIKDLQLKDFVLTFDVRNPEDTGDHRDCCVFFCYQNPQQFYYAHLGKKPDPASGQIMIVNRKPRAALTENNKEIPWTSGWHKVKVTHNSKSGDVKVYFDDMKTPCLSVTDKTFGRGQIGIGSFDDINDFDNVKVFGK